jgi:hypothetical protein
MRSIDLRTVARAVARVSVAPAALAAALATLPSALAGQGASGNPSTAVSRWTPPALPAGKKPITQDTYDEWRTISGASLSNDGKWVAYTVSPVVGEGALIVRSTAGSTEYANIGRGFTGRPQLQPAADSAAQFSAAPAQFSADSRIVAFTVYPSRADVERARARRGTPQPRSGMGLVRVADGNVTRVSNVRSFRLARNGGKYLAYLLEDTTAAARPAGAPAQNGTPAPAGPRREYGATLVLRDLAAGTDTRIEGVTNYAFDENEQWLGYTVTTRDGANNGAFVRQLSTGAVTTLIAGSATYRGFTFDRAGKQVAFVSDVNDSTPRPRFSVYHASLAPAKGKSVAARRLVDATEAPEGLLIADRGQVSFTREGNALIFSLGNVPADSIPADSLVDKAVYDLWHWKDAAIMPQQKVTANRDRNRTYTALYTLNANKWTRLANDSMRVTISNDGKRILGLNALEYAIPQFWGEGATDVYLIDPLTGARDRKSVV